MAADREVPEAEISAVDGDKGTVEEKRVAMLGKWREKFAYYQALIEALLAPGNPYVQLIPPRLLEQVSDVSNYTFVWLIIKHVMYIVRGVVVIMLPIMLSHTADGGPLPIKTEPHTQSREYIKIKDGKLC